MPSKAVLTLAVLLLLVLLLVVGGVVFIKSDYASRRVCEMVQRTLDEQLGVPVSIATCELGLLPPALEVHEVKLRAADGSPLLEVASMKVELGSLALLAGQIWIDLVRVERPSLSLTIEQGRVAKLPQLKLPSGIGTTGSSPATKNEIVLKHVEIVNAHVDLLYEQRALLRLNDSHLELLSTGNRRFEVMTTVASGSLDLRGGQGTSLTISESKLKAAIEPGKIDLALFRIGLDSADFNASGPIVLAPTLSPTVTFTAHGPLALLHQFLASIPPMDGRATVRGSAIQKNGELTASGEIDVAGFGIATVADVTYRSRFQIDRHQLVLEEVQATSRGGSVSGKASLTLTAPLDFAGSFQLRQVDLQESLAMGGVHITPITFQGAGKVDCRGQFQGKSGAFVTLDARLDLETLIVRPRQNDTPVLMLTNTKLTTGATFIGQQVEVMPSMLEVGQTRIATEGTIHFKGGQVQARIQSSQMQLADLSGQAPLAISGGGIFGLDVTGHFPAPELALSLVIDNVTLAGRTYGKLQGTVGLSKGHLTVNQLVFSRPESTIQFSGGLDLYRPFVVNGQMDFKSVKPHDILNLLRVSTDLPIDGLLTGQIAASGSLTDPQVVFNVGFRNLTAWNQVFEEGGISGKLKSGAWQFETFQARMGTGWLYASGGISPDRELDLTVYSTGLRAASFNALRAFREFIDFRLDLSVDIKGPLRSPAFQGWAKFYDTKLKGQEVEDSFVSADVSAESITVKGHFLGTTAELFGEAQLQQGLPYTAHLGINDANLGRLFAWVGSEFNLQLAAVGTIDVEGRLMLPTQVRGRLLLTQLSVEAVGLQLNNRGPIELALEHDLLTVVNTAISGTETELSLSGNLSLAAGPRLSLNGDVGLAVLPLLTNALTRADGKATLRLALGGTWQALEPSGTIEVTAELVRPKGLPLEFGQVSGTLQVKPRQLELVSLRGEVGGGSFSAQGWIGLRNFRPGTLTVGIDVDHVRYDVSDTLWGVGTGILRLSGEVGGMLKLGGDINVENGAFDEHTALVSLSDGIFRRRRGQTTRTYDQRREVLAFNLHLTLPEKFQVNYNLDVVGFQSEMQGDLRVTGTNQRLGLQGELQSLSGELSYLSKDFSVSSAQVRFEEEYTIVPRLDIVASRVETVERDEGTAEYQVELHLTGEGDDVRVGLRSSPSLDERDIITLLSLGVTSRDVAALKGQSLVGPVGDILFQQLGLNRRLRQLFQSNVIQPKYIRLRSRFSGQTKTTAPHLETGVKFPAISDKLELDYSRALFDATDQNVDLSYQLTDEISGRLRWEDSPEYSQGNIGLDVRFHWEW
jgi:translocation and assembly module TamB